MLGARFKEKEHFRNLRLDLEWLTNNIYSLPENAQQLTKVLLQSGWTIKLLPSTQSAVVRADANNFAFSYYLYKKISIIICSELEVIQLRAFANAQSLAENTP